MKKFAALLLALLSLCAVACAEAGANVEVIRLDGVSVVVLTPEAVVYRARLKATGTEGDEPAGFVLPRALTTIGEEAFAGCESLREITISATVHSIDDHALDGCADVTVFGSKGTEAERFANAAGFTFVDTSAEPEPSGEPEAPVHEAPAVVLPFVSEG